MMNPKELLQQSDQELTRQAHELRAAIRTIRFKIRARQHNGVRTLRHSKRDLARVLTALRLKANSSTTTV